MRFKGDVMRKAATTLAALLSVATLASCGGSSQVEAFQPSRVIAFGDENSVMDTTASGATSVNGYKHTINGVTYVDATADPLVIDHVDCAQNPLWIQTVAASFGLLFNECQTGTVVYPSRIVAQAGAKAADLATQVTLFTSGNDGTLTAKDLATVWIGANDLVDIYNNHLTDPSLDVIAAAGQAGTAVGAQVVRLTDLGAKVLVTTLPDLGSSPMATAEEAIAPGTGRPKLLSDMTVEFNKRLRLKLEDVKNGGRSVALVLADDVIRTLVAFPTNYSLVNTINVACDIPAKTPDLLHCNPLTLVTGATPAGYLWADETHLGSVGQSQIGLLATTRAHNNPF